MKTPFGKTNNQRNRTQAHIYETERERESGAMRAKMTIFVAHTRLLFFFACFFLPSPCTQDFRSPFYPRAWTLLQAWRSRQLALFQSRAPFFILWFIKFLTVFFFHFPTFVPHFCRSHTTSFFFRLFFFYLRLVRKIFVLLFIRALGLSFKLGGQGSLLFFKVVYLFLFYGLLNF